jgi:cysteine desulfurase
MLRRVYLDNNATTPVLPEVVEAMRPYFGERFGNASSIHSHGQQTRAAVERARESVAALIGARASEIVFTSGGTEADNLAVFGVTGYQSPVTGHRESIPDDHIITSTIEHHAVLNACRHLEQVGCSVTYVPVDASGVVDPSDVRRALRPSTKLISIMFANNETGMVQPVAEIGAIAREADVYFHTDAVQAVGKIPVRVDEIGCDLLTLSAHKLHGPQGVGALYVRKGTPLEAQIYGGRHERSRRAGTENVPGIVGLGRAAELAAAGLSRGDDLKMAELRDRLERELLAIEACGVNGAGTHPSQSARRMGHPHDSVSSPDSISSPDPEQKGNGSGLPLRVPNTSNIYFEGIDGEALVIALDLKGLAVSTGAACSSGAIEPSHVLMAMGMPAEQARASVRFSLGKMNSAEDVEFALGLVPETVGRLRELSPVWKDLRDSSHELRATT